MHTGGPFTGSGKHFNPSTDITQLYSQQHSGSLEGSPLFSTASSQNSLLFDDATYSYGTMFSPPPVSLVPINYGVGVAPPPTSVGLGPVIGGHQPTDLSFARLFDSSQALEHPSYANMGSPPMGVDALGFATQLHGVPPFGLTPGYSTQLDKLVFQGNNNPTPSHAIDDPRVYRADVDVYALPIPRGDGHIQPSNPFETGPHLDILLDASEKETMDSTTTTPDPGTSPADPVDDNEGIHIQSTDIGSSSTETVSGQQNTAESIEGLPLQKIDPYLQRKPLPSSETGVGSRNGTESWTCLYPDCKHRPFPRQDQARGHVAGHLGVKPFRCEYCQRGFARHADRKRHVDKKTCRPRPKPVQSNRPRSIAPTPGSSSSFSVAPLGDRDVQVCPKPRPWVLFLQLGGWRAFCLRIYLWFGLQSWLTICS